ncbi:PepSY-like domain-containing protein [Niabella hibiscisoli]|uniref:PepSY-like domain-containing protein n=1 Tax=Niabella hibiscisoli TaxID=1825928 RepID=UPI001F0FC7C5|nr:PepSY-like domain-containing protein [Niabella hibiscisoli]MCH5721078.1 PepSY-like domain-containing protein [Niabella hibiscisoli]
MKTITIIFMFLFAGNNIHAQEVQPKNVPSIIINALQLKFPKAGDVVWELEKGLYKAEFEIGRLEYEVWLDYSGKVKRWKQDFDKEQLPDAVKLSIRKSFDGFVPSSVERLQEGRSVFYKMRLTKSKEKHKVLFTENGKLLSDQVL